MQWLVDAFAQSWASLKFVAVVLVAGLLIEALRPAQRGQPLRHVAFNLGYVAFVVTLNNVLMPPLMALIKPVVSAHGLMLPVAFPDGAGWQVLQALAFFFIYDFFYYWFHRAQHTIAVAWPLHKLHHSDQSVNITTTLRHHWLEEPIRVWLILLPIGLLFDQKPVTTGWIATAMMLFGYFIHMNVRLPLGPVTPWIAGPQWHRLHHSILPQHTDRNFSAFFPLFDILFGTYSKPGRDEYPATGLHSGETLNGPIKSTLSPFRDWHRMIRNARKPALAHVEQGPVQGKTDQQGDPCRQQHE
ncbi:MAG TPA: sterol desaturase family protein [Dokdonella sp.]|jgi:sterol desaturase/sphingolipid hydroxylase (fatty acid hydroxylase superfamily)|nr:sterol desaturase family protein [Dokdonella sp.]